MNILDIIIYILLFISIFNGIRDGLIKGASLLIGAILGLLLGAKYSSVIVPLCMNLFGIGATEARVISYIIIFLIVGFLITLFHKLFIKTNHLFGFWDRLFGAVFAVFESCILISLIFILLRFLFDFPSEDLIADSFVYNTMYDFAPSIFNYIKLIFPDTGHLFEELKKLI
jgi:uncharacterized membrane protein required for colicin V production